jgi:hypothetical protein
MPSKYSEFFRSIRLASFLQRDGHTISLLLEIWHGWARDLTTPALDACFISLRGSRFSDHKTRELL